MYIKIEVTSEFGWAQKFVFCRIHNHFFLFLHQAGVVCLLLCFGFLFFLEVVDFYTCSWKNPEKSKWCYAMWHKVALRAQYLVNLCKICTTKRSWKGLHSEGIKLNPLLYETWFTTTPTFRTFSLCNFRFKLISENKQCTESCKFSYCLGVYPISMKNRKILNVFLFSFWTLLSLIWDILHPC